MSSSALTVLLQNRQIGTVTRTNDRLRFSYDEQWMRTRGATPLSLSMPLEVRDHTHRPVDAFLWGLLPDNLDVLARWGREFHTSPRNGFGLLATPIGQDCAGAAQFVVPERLTEVQKLEGTIDWLSQADVAQRLRDLRDDHTSWLGQTLSGQFSLAGAQAKTALYFDGGRWGVPHGPIPTTHIIKPTVAMFDDHDLNEHLCLTAARNVGMTVARTSIARFEDVTAVVVERYDRIRNSDGFIGRVHQEDVCQALGVHPRSKYQADGGPAPTDVVTLFREVMPSRAASEATWAFLDALAFNWLIGGTDAHAKNYSLLLSGTQVRLAPLYDVASALPYDRLDPMKLRLAMKIGGQYRLRNIVGRNWSKLAREVAVEPDELRTRVSDLSDRLPDAFADASRSVDDDIDSALPARLLDAVSNQTKNCRRRLEAIEAQ